MQTSTIKTSSYSESGGKRLKRLKEEGMKEGKEEKERNRFSEEKQSIRVSVPLHYSYMDVQLYVIIIIIIIIISNNLFYYQLNNNKIFLNKTKVQNSYLNIETNNLKKMNINVLCNKKNNRRE